MEKINKWCLVLFSSICSLASLTSLTSLTACSFDSYTISDKNTNNEDKSQHLEFVNYFAKNHHINEKVKKKYKERISEVINKYRLKEWNEYFKKTDNKLQKSSVLQLKYEDYKTTNVKKELSVNSIIRKSKINIKWTSTYKNQDEQFRYFNDFINIINEEKTINSNKQYNHEDFLFLRWMYYQLEAADKYWSIKLTKEEKPIFEVGIDDWIQAILKGLVEFDFTDLLDIVNRFLEYYGLPSISKDSGDNYLDNLNIVENSVFHLMLVSDDLVMRFSSKPDHELERYPLWKAKTKRVVKMYDLALEKYNLIFDSFTKGEISDKSDNYDDEQMEQAKEYFDGLSKWFKELLDVIASILIRINLTDYTDSSILKK